MNQMKKTLSLSQVVLFGLAYMTPIIVLGTFGVLAVTTEGAVSGAYLAALIAMLFTAHSYGRMASAYPVWPARPMPMCDTPSTTAWASSPAGRSCSITCSFPW